MDAPIAQTLGVGETETPAKRIWHDYKVQVVPDHRYGHELLQVKAKAAFVTYVRWTQPGRQAEVKLCVICR